jgi:hypothetical protein
MPIRAVARLFERPRQSFCWHMAHARRAKRAESKFESKLVDCTVQRKCSCGPQPDRYLLHRNNMGSKTGYSAHRGRHFRLIADGISSAAASRVLRPLRAGRAQPTRRQRHHYRYGSTQAQHERQPLSQCPFAAWRRPFEAAQFVQPVRCFTSWARSFHVAHDQVEDLPSSATTVQPLMRHPASACRSSW